VLPSDLFTSESVASVSGLSGTGAGIGTIVAFMLIRHFSDARVAMATHAFDPLVITAGVIPFIGIILVLFLVRNTSATDQGLGRRFERVTEHPEWQFTLLHPESDLWVFGLRMRGRSGCSPCRTHRLARFNLS